MIYVYVSIILLHIIIFFGDCVEISDRKIILIFFVVTIEFLLTINLSNIFLREFSPLGIFFFRYWK